MADPANTFKNHWKSIKELSGNKRYEFIWEYYKIHLTAIVIGIIALIWVVNHYIINPPEKTYLNVSFYGGYVFDESLSEVEDGLTGLILDEYKARYRILAENYNVSSSDYQIRQAHSQRFMGNMLLKDIDIIIVYSDEFDGLVKQGIAMKCEEYLTAQMSAVTTDRIVRGRIENDDGSLGSEFGYGIRLDGNAFFADRGFNTEDMVLIVVSNSKRIDIVIEALNIILGL